MTGNRRCASERHDDISQVAGSRCPSTLTWLEARDQRFFNFTGFPGPRAVTATRGDVPPSAPSLAPEISRRPSMTRLSQNGDACGVETASPDGKRASVGGLCGGGDHRPGKGSSFYGTHQWACSAERATIVSGGEGSWPSLPTIPFQKICRSGRLKEFPHAPFPTTLGSGRRDHIG